jgi:hypothetical protein
VFPTALSLFLELDQLYWVSSNYVSVYHDHTFEKSKPGLSNELVKSYLHAPSKLSSPGKIKQ